MKKRAFVALMLIVVLTSSLVVAQDNFPNKFKLKERVISLTTTLDIKGPKKENLGSVVKKLVSLTTTFDYNDADGNLVATAKKALVSLGTKISVYDHKGVLIGVIHENVAKSLFKVVTTYAVMDANGNKIAVSNKKDVVSTSITIKSIDGKNIAKLKRPAINLLSDTWNVEINKKGIVDMRILVIMAAFKTSSDKS